MAGEKLFLLIRFSLLFLALQAQKQRFAIEPYNQTVLVNSRVILPCRVAEKQGILQWTKDDFGLGIHRNLSGYDRYNMIGSDQAGDFYLEIFPVTLEDDGKYQCQVSPGSDYEEEIRSTFAFLTVLVVPEPPKIKPVKQKLVTNKNSLQHSNILTNCTERSQTMMIFNIVIFIIIVAAVIVVVFVWCRLCCKHNRLKSIKEDNAWHKMQFKASTRSLNIPNLQIEFEPDLAPSNRDDDVGISVIESVNGSMPVKIEVEVAQPAKPCQKRFSDNYVVMTPINTKRSDGYFKFFDYEDFYPPLVDPNSLIVQEAPLQLNAVQSMNILPMAGLSTFETFQQGDIPNVLAMDPRFNDDCPENADLQNLEIGIPKPENLSPRPPPSPYVQVGLLKDKKGLSTIYE